MLRRRKAVGSAANSATFRVEGGGVEAREIADCDVDIGVLGASIEEGSLLLDDEALELGR